MVHNGSSIHTATVALSSIIVALSSIIVVGEMISFVGIVGTGSIGVID